MSGRGGPGHAAVAGDEAGLLLDRDQPVDAD